MKLLLPLFLFISFSSFGQNYECLQFGPKNYFINGDGYVRGMRIDSVSVVGSDFIYHPYRSERLQNYYPGIVTPIDTFGASWLGKDVIKKPNGTFIFNNMWDTVFIRTQAHTGDSWMFFNDTTVFRYIATVTAEDTMTFLGIVDSIKKITITADSLGVTNINDPVNNFQIILSKNNGFVQIFDLYTFPYHNPNPVSITSTYHNYSVSYIDYYLDVLLGNTSMMGPWGIWHYGSYPDTANSVFHLFPFYNPTNTEINGVAAAGDVVETHFATDGGYMPGSFERYDLDSVFEDASGSLADTVLGKAIWHDHGYVSRVEYFTTSHHGSSLPDTNRLLYDMPEEGRGSTLFFKAKDYLDLGGGICDSAPSYTFYAGPRDLGYTGADMGYEPFWSISKLMLGFGNFYSDYYNALGREHQTNSYSYYNKRGHGCGFRAGVTAGVTNYSRNIKLLIAPNPATDHITITADQLLDNATVAICDMTGRQIITEQFRDTRTINTSNWPRGIYLVTITTENIIVERKKIVIE